MNHVVFKLVVDYLRRTLGVWVVVAFLHMMQAATLFAGGTKRAPIVGGVVAALAFAATFNSPQSVMRTLPIERRDFALARWWVALGCPIVLSAFCLYGAWLANGTRGFPRPEIGSLGSLVLICAAAIAVLSMLPLPRLSPGRRRKNLALFVFVWGVLAVGSVRGLSLSTFSSTGWAVVMACGFGLALMSFIRAMRGEVLTVRVPFLTALARTLSSRRESAASVSTHRGWSVVGMQLLRTTVLLVVGGIVAISLLRHLLPELDAVNAYRTAMAMGYVSIIGVAASVLVRRWIGAIRVIQTLPVRDSSLALMICLVLTVPPLITCIATSALHAVYPAWGIPIPTFIFPIFAIFPMLVVPVQSGAPASAAAYTVQQWSPVLQVGVWPLWAGGFASLAFSGRLPAWFNLSAMGLGIVFAICGYALVYNRIRSGAGLEHRAGPLATT